MNKGLKIIKSLKVLTILHIDSNMNPATFVTSTDTGSETALRTTTNRNSGDNMGKPNIANPSGFIFLVMRGVPVEPEDLEAQGAAAPRVIAHLSFVLCVLPRPGLK